MTDARPYINPIRRASIQTAFRRLEKTVEAVFWDVQWKSFIIDRPKTGYGQDVWKQTGMGEGKLRDTGVIEPSVNEDILMPEAPYRMQCLASSGLSSDHYIRIRDRVFKVEAFKPREGDRTHANAYLSEQFFTQLPVDGVAVNAGGSNL